METVYSVEEDGDSENNQDPSESTENSECEERRTKNLGNGKGRLQDLYGSFERLAQESDSPPSERPRDESQQAQVCNSFCLRLHFVITVFCIDRFFFKSSSLAYLHIRDKRHRRTSFLEDLTMYVISMYFLPRENRISSNLALSKSAASLYGIF